MKHILLIYIIYALSQVHLHAQQALVWFDTGIKVQYGSTGLYNQAVADIADIKYALSSGTKIGGKVGINIGNNGLSIDVMFNNTKATFDRNVNLDQSVIKLKSIDLYTLYRNEANRAYFEIGPMFSFMGDGSRWDVIEGIAQPESSLADQLKNGISAVLGFGTNLIGTEGSFSAKLGVRVEYGISDIVSDFGRSVDAPVHQPDLYISGYKGSHPIFVGFVLEFNWGIGYYGRSQCGGRSKFFTL